MTSLEKRLLTLSYIGVTIQYQDGHRWLSYQEEIGDMESLLEMYNRINETNQGEYELKSKIYGDVYEVLDKDMRSKTYYVTTIFVLSCIWPIISMMLIMEAISETVESL